MSFTILQNEKTSLQAIKKVQKSESSNFSKGFNRRFWSKNGHFPKFIFQTIQARKMSFTIFQNEKTPFQAIKTRSSNSRKIDIFYKGVNPCFWYKNGHFANFFFSRNIAQENVFYDILERENASLGYKKKFKKSKISHFFKGVNPCFWSKNGHFSKFILQTIQARKISFTMFQNEKTPFKAIKTTG